MGFTTDPIIPLTVDFPELDLSWLDDEEDDDPYNGLVI
jgi:hypothetical protein